MILRITDTTDTHGLTMFPKELKIGGKKKAACAEPTLESGDAKWGLGRHLLDEAGPLAAQPEHPGTQQRAGSAPARVRYVWAPISITDPVHLLLYNGWGREWLQNYIFAASVFLFGVAGVEPRTAHVLGKPSATVLCAQFSTSTHLLGTGFSYVDQVSLELDPPPSDLSSWHFKPVPPGLDKTRYASQINNRESNKSKNETVHPLLNNGTIGWEMADRQAPQ